MKELLNMQNENAMRVLAGTIEKAKDAEALRQKLSPQEFEAVVQHLPRVATYDEESGVEFYAIVGEGKENVHAFRVTPNEHDESVTLAADAKVQRLAKTAVLRDMEVAARFSAEWAQAKGMLREIESAFKAEVAKDAPLAPKDEPDASPEQPATL